MKIALLPGGFKPPHLGHYNMAKYLADFADQVIVRIGQKERDGIGPELAAYIWNVYKLSDPDERAKKLDIKIAKSPSPVKDVYDYVELEAPEGSTVILGMGEKDASDGRYNSIPKFAEPRNIKADIELVPPQAGGISGTRMREIIKSKDKDTFFSTGEKAIIPDFLSEENKENIWAKLVDATIPDGIKNINETTERKTLYAFDLDDTLITSNSQVIITNKTTGKVTKITPAQYATYIPNDNEELDFSEFAKLVNPQAIGKNFQDFAKILKIISRKPDHTAIILTARQPEVQVDVNSFLEKYNLDNIQIHAVASSDPQAKADVIQDYINNGYTKIRFYDDALKNVKAIQALELTNPNTNILAKKVAFNTGLNEFMAGAMNKEEMAKHNANMRKLRKFLSKQTDQMVQVPTNLTKGLRRKLYEGSKYDAGTVKIQRLIFNEFKDQLGKPFKNEEWSEYWLEGPEYIVFFDIGVEFIPKKMLIPYSISGDAGEDDIQIKITYNPESFPESFNDLNAEIKETVRHELEHLAQYNFPNKELFEKFKGKIPFYKYLTLNHETPAFVRGLNKRAKFKKISLNDVFEEFFDDFVDQFKSEDEINIVRQIWINYAQENLPGAKLDENYPPYKANQVQQTRYKASDTFTNDRKKAKKLGYLEEMKLFSKNWWLDIITEELLNEGGAAGHMAHPFDLPNVNTGKDLIKSFEQAAESLKKEPGSVKIDGVNASIRLINNAGKRQFAMDRGSKKELDLRGVTKADLEARFGAGHGMIKAGGDVLDIFNTALPTIQEELEALGLWDNPNIMFNMEYVSGKSNVQDYGKNFLAIHGLLEVESKEVQGARGMLVKRVTSEKNFAQSDMDELLKKLEPFAKKKGFEIYGSVPTTFTKDPDFKAELSKNYTIDFAEGSKTKSLASWLNDVTNIPKTDRLKMNIEETDSIKDVGALSKQVYFAVFGGENVDSLFNSEEEVQKAIQGATTYLATEKLGDAILDVLDSPMGSVNDHEGVVIRDDKISPRPFKITGKFITGGVSSQFQAK